MGNFETREEWLTAALQPIARHIADKANETMPDNVKASCGFPGGGSARKRIGECWSTQSSAIKASEIFISPVMSDPVRILDVLLHEAIHATVGVEHGHKAPFKRVAVACGLTGKMTATVAGPELETVLQDIAVELGPYPHGALSLSDRKKQKTRLVKCECMLCGYIVRTTSKWIESAGAPLCPCSGDAMMVDGAEDSEDSDGE
jgi:hypothetical protein